MCLRPGLCDPGVPLAILSTFVQRQLQSAWEVRHSPPWGTHGWQGPQYIKIAGRVKVTCLERSSCRLVGSIRKVYEPFECSTLLEKEGGVLQSIYIVILFLSQGPRHNVASFFSGIGGLELGLGPCIPQIWYLCGFLIFL